MNRVLKLLVPVMLVLSMSACTSTMEGIQKDFSETGQWLKGEQTSEPTALDRAVGAIPTGYAGQNKRGVVLKPPGTTEEGNGVQWHDVGDYKNYVTDMAAPAPVPQPTEYTEGVQVFDLDSEPAPIMYNDNVTVIGGGYGQMLEQVYFMHGSSALDGNDRQKIKNAAGSINAAASVEAVTVVGHASKRVEGVMDPVKRKMINFEMAQKRANAVTNELKKAGVQPAWVTSVSKGEDEPHPSPMGKSQEVADRRVEIYLK